MKLINQIINYNTSILHYSLRIYLFIFFGLINKNNKFSYLINNTVNNSFCKHVFKIFHLN